MMKILHITPHLGGGVGKAHAALRGALPRTVRRTFALLEEPREGRYLKEMLAGGDEVVVAAGNLDGVAALAREADIVQFEFWNHPRLFECLARCVFPPLRSLFWSHISGLGGPVIPPGLMQEAGRFVFTTEASRPIPGAAGRNIAVINGGFGFPGATACAVSQDRKPIIAYLGTVDFVKMHPGFFDAIDSLRGDDIQVSVWGAADPAGSVVARAQAMRHPDRIRFCGDTTEPAVALCGADIFFYPLRRDHYGTAENALVEAMSLGLVPVVLDNPAEQAIVCGSETGLIAHSIEQCAALLQMLLTSADLRQKLSRNAIRHVAQTQTPQRSAQDFMALWRDLLKEAPRVPDFGRAIGSTPADWFAATQRLPEVVSPSIQPGQAEKPAKGTLAHFRSAFPEDASLAALGVQP
ncbi:MAG: glycosyltransferase family 4 protein [Pseudolabrys sp.]